MDGIAGRQKKCVEVLSSTSTEGVVTPQAIVWDTGIRYKIDCVLDRRRARSMRSNCTGIRYTIRVGSTTTYLWYEEPRWFVEAKVATLPEG